MGITQLQICEPVAIVGNRSEAWLLVISPKPFSGQYCASGHDLCSGESMLKEETDRQIDNTRARVTRHKMAPGASTGFHRHDFDYVIVPVTDGRMRIVEGGRESVSELAAGVSYFRPAGVEHDVINGGDRDLIFVEIELLP